jgi:hypothetical protein
MTSNEALMLEFQRGRDPRWMSFFLAVVGLSMDSSGVVWKAKRRRSWWSYGLLSDLSR